MNRRAVYTGSFDPITLGHLNVIQRSSRLVDELIVGVGINIDKQSLFTGDERAELIRRSPFIIIEFSTPGKRSINRALAPSTFG